MDYLQRKFGGRRVAKLLEIFEKWGTRALVLSCAVPFPFPTSAFFAAAGVLDYPLRRFLIVVVLSRGARYVAIAVIASHYGRHFIRLLRNPSQYYGWLVAIGMALVMAIAIGFLLRKRLQTAD